MMPHATRLMKLLVPGDEFATQEEHINFEHQMEEDEEEVQAAEEACVEDKVSTPSTKRQKLESPVPPGMPSHHSAVTVKAGRRSTNQPFNNSLLSLSPSQTPAQQYPLQQDLQDQQSIAQQPPQLTPSQMTDAQLHAQFRETMMIKGNGCLLTKC